MKKLFVISIVLMATVTFATAQQQQFRNRTPEEQAKIQTDRLTELLKLTNDQKAKIQAIELDLAKERSTQMQKNQGNREGMMAAMQEISKKREAKYKEVLTADQFKKYQEDFEQRMQNRQRQRTNN